MYVALERPLLLVNTGVIAPIVVPEIGAPTVSSMRVFSAADGDAGRLDKVDLKVMVDSLNSNRIALPVGVKIERPAAKSGEFGVAVIVVDAVTGPLFDRL